MLVVALPSPATEAGDRGVKLPAHRRLASVPDIRPAAPDRVAVEHCARQGGRWAIADRGPGGPAGLPVEIAADDLSAGLGLGPEGPAAA